MRIESLSPYRYFLQVIKEEPLKLRPYSYVLVLIPLLGICFLFDWDRDLIIFVLLGYFSAAVGFFAAYKSRNTPPPSIKKLAYQSMVLDYLDEVVILQSKQSKKITFANTAFYKTLGFEPDRISDMRFEDFVDADDLPLFGAARAAKTGVLSIRPLDKSHQSIEMYKENGEKIWMDLTAKTSVENGAFTMYTFKEVTDQVLLDKATEQFARDLMQRKSKLGKISTYVSLKVS